MRHPMYTGRSMVHQNKDVGCWFPWLLLLLLEVVVAPPGAGDGDGEDEDNVIGFACVLVQSNSVLMERNPCVVDRRGVKDAVRIFDVTALVFSWMSCCVWFGRQRSEIHSKPCFVTRSNMHFVEYGTCVISVPFWCRLVVVAMQLCGGVLTNGGCKATSSSTAPPLAPPLLSMSKRDASSHLYGTSKFTLRLCTTVFLASGPGASKRQNCCPGWFMVQQKASTHPEPA